MVFYISVKKVFHLRREITAAIGIGLMVFIAAVDRSNRAPGYLVGLIPLLIGVALLSYAYLLAPKQS